MRSAVFYRSDCDPDLGLAPLFTALGRAWFGEVPQIAAKLSPIRTTSRALGDPASPACERQCKFWVAWPIIYGTSATRAAQFARGSADPGWPGSYLLHLGDPGLPVGER